MKTNWTPGPWALEGSIGMVKAANSVLVALVYGDHHECEPDDRMKANARLIALAPEMASALTEVFECGENGALYDRIGAILARLEG